MALALRRFGLDDDLTLAAVQSHVEDGAAFRKGDAGQPLDHDRTSDDGQPVADRVGSVLGHDDAGEGLPEGASSPPTPRNCSRLADARSNSPVGGSRKQETEGLDGSALKVQLPRRNSSGPHRCRLCSRDRGLRFRFSYPISA